MEAVASPSPFEPPFKRGVSSASLFESPSKRGSAELLVSPATLAPGRSCRVKLFHCSKAQFELLVGCLVDRSVEPLLQGQDEALVAAFQKLAWLQEWCRGMRVPRLELASGADTVELNLRALVDTPKQCNRCGAEERFVNCARCCVASWCSEKCIKGQYEAHQQSASCVWGQRFREFFGL
jgi:hypothetical protein